MFDEFLLVRPARPSNQLLSLQRKRLLSRVATGTPGWQLTHAGRAKATELVSDFDAAALHAEVASANPVNFGGATFGVIDPAQAPPELIGPLSSFFEKHPFETNVFIMTRFPSGTVQGDLDPVSQAIDAIRDACAARGLRAHLASDRQIVDDLWPNVLAHIWGSKFGVALFENRTGKGLNLNLNIEVGSALTLGRRTAILKDPDVDLPTDLVGKIYKEVDLASREGVLETITGWLTEDLSVG